MNNDERITFVVITMRSDYQPSETFCCVCGVLLKDKQIADNIQGVIEHRNVPGKISVDPFDGYLCKEHSAIIAKNISGGLREARRQYAKLQEANESQMGEQDNARRRRT